LDRLPQPERDSFLIAVAKQAIIKYGPDFYDYYETNRTPIVITRIVITNEDEDLNVNARAGMVEYRVNYSTSKEFLDKYPNSAPYYMIVRVWEDTGLAAGIRFGNNGLVFRSEADLKIEDHTVYVLPTQNRGRHSMSKSEYEQVKRNRERK
jgi:hypothetical protein